MALLSRLLLLSSCVFSFFHSFTRPFRLEVRSRCLLVDGRMRPCCVNNARRAAAPFSNRQVRTSRSGRTFRLKRDLVAQGRQTERDRKHKSRKDKERQSPISYFIHLKRLEEYPAASYETNDLYIVFYSYIKSDYFINVKSC